MVSSPSLNAVATSASCWSAESVARSRQLEVPPSTADVPVLQAPVAAPPSAGAPVPDPQQAACAVQNAIASWEARAAVVPWVTTPRVDALVHPSRKAKRSAGDTARTLP